MLGAVWIRGADLVPVDTLGVRLARGFRIALWAGPDLAHDIRAMALDRGGRVVVSGPGYIRVLLDRDGDGLAESGVDYASGVSGCEGLCFDGDLLYAVGDEGLQAYRDQDRDGAADGPPQMLMPLDTAGHGAASVRKGSDGWLYVVTGNEMAFGTRHAALPGSPIRAIEAGALLRLPPNGQAAECVAHGLYHPRDMDFNWLGDLFTADGDALADRYLPWHVPARVCQVEHGAHLGVRLRGGESTWPRPLYSPDTTEPLAVWGSGVPSGVVCYRHYQFPAVFRNGLFFGDWISGRLWFTPLAPEDSGYRAAPEVFLEPMGISGFAPVDLAVARDGALLVATGGKGTAGSVYRIVWPPGGAEVAVHHDLSQVGPHVVPVLNAPQPLEAWSRATWVDMAMELGPAPFASVVTDPRHPPPGRVRAIEVLTELFGGLAPGVAAAGAQSPVPAVRARTAWSLGRVPPPNAAPLLLGMAADRVPAVCRCALAALMGGGFAVDGAALGEVLAANLGHPDAAVRRSAARAASLLPEAIWAGVWERCSRGPVAARLGATLALLERGAAPSFDGLALEAALGVLEASADAADQLAALRLAIRALGDDAAAHPALEAFAPYEPGVSLEGQPEVGRRVARAVRRCFPGVDPDVNREAARLLALVRDDAPSTAKAVLERITAQSAPEDDFHYLAVLARVRGALPSKGVEALARAILSLDRKWEGRQSASCLRWNDRFMEVVQALVRREPALGAALVRDPRWLSPAHAILASLLGSAPYEMAARRFLAEAKRNPNFGWTRPLVEVVGSLPEAEARSVLRQQWGRVALRDDLVVSLAQAPESADREKFLAGLSSAELRVVRASLEALDALPAGGTGKGLGPALLLLRRLIREPAESAMRARAVKLIERESGRTFRVRESGLSPAALRAAYQPVFDGCLARHPQLARLLEGESRESVGAWERMLKAVRWDGGDPGRGEGLYRTKGCHACHNGSGVPGPSLMAIAARQSPAALMDSVQFPQRDVAAPYRSTLVRLPNQQSLTGRVVAETADVVLLQTGPAATVRLRAGSVVARQVLLQSLMPSGLLGDVGAQGLADLYSHLRSL